MAKTIKTELMTKRFAKEYVRNGMNATRAYKKLKPHVKDNTARAEGSVYLAKPDTRAHIIRCMEEAGVTPQKLSEKVAEFLSFSPDDKHGFNVVDAGIKHSRAILGMDAIRKQHIQVDKRSVNVNVETSLNDLDSLIKSSK